MAKRTKFLVEWRDGAARFSDEYDAHKYAFAKSKSFGAADVYHPQGLIAQWRFGELTEEFAHLGDLARTFSLLPLAA